MDNKKFELQLDKILQTFDQINEWADLIGFLSKLLKLFQNVCYPVPRKLLLAKRLGQCLNPALPTGVHQKAIEVYEKVFMCYKPEQLALDCGLWTFGLFPFCSYCQMIVKPSLLRLYEQFLIPIAHLLKHGLKGLILGILPLLEEENNEFFDKGLSLLDLVEQKSKDFYPSLWLGLCQSSQLRLGGCHYLQRKLKKLEQKDISLVLIDCITQMLLDPQPLVNRGILDILVQKIPIDYIQSQELMRAAISVLLKRDSSLNRRLFQWLDTEQNEEKAQVLIGNAIRSMMQDADVGKPYQIMVSLMDKPGGHVVFENLFIDMIQSTMTNPNAINFMSMLNESVEPFVLWKQFSLYISDLNQQKLDLFHFYFDQYHTQDEQSEKIHKPYFIYLLSLKLSDGHYLDSLLSLISKLLSQLPKSVFTTSWHLSDLKTRKPDITSPLSATSPLMYIPDEIIYEPWTVNQEDILLMYTMEEEQLKSLYTRLLIGEPILSTSLETIARKIQAEKSHYKVWSKILQLFYTNGSKIEPWMYDFMKSDDLETFVCILKTLEKIKARLKDPKPMFDQIWSFMESNASPNICGLLDCLCLITDTKTVESLMLVGLDKPLGMDKFGLWLKCSGKQDFSRPILYVLSDLLSKDALVVHRAKTWIQAYLVDHSLALNPLLYLLTQNTDLVQDTRLWKRKQLSIYCFTKPINFAQIEFAFSILIHLLDQPLFLDSLKKPSQSFVHMHIQPLNHLESLCLISLRFLEAQLQEQEESQREFKRLESLKLKAAQFLLRLLSLQHLSLEMSQMLHQSMLQLIKTLVYLEHNALLPLALQILHICAYHMKIQKAPQFETIYCPQDQKSEFVVLMELALKRDSNKALIRDWIEHLKQQLTLSKPKFQLVHLPLLQSLSQQVLKLEKKMFLEDLCVQLLSMILWISELVLSQVPEQKHWMPSFLTHNIFGSEQRLSIVDQSDEFVKIVPQLICLISEITSRLDKRAWTACGHLLELFYEKFPQQTLESLVLHSTLDHAYDLSLLLSNTDPKNVMEHLTQALKARITQQRLLPVQELLSYIQLHVQKHPFSLTHDQWTNIHLYLQHQLSTLSHKPLFVNLSKFMITLFQSNVLLDKSIKEAEEDLSKCLEHVIYILAKSVDAGPWKKTDLFTKPTLVEFEGYADFGLSPQSESQESETDKKWMQDVFTWFIQTLPDLKYLNDKQSQVLQSLANLLIIPCIKKTSQSPFLDAIVSIMVETASMQSGYKMWRKELWDCFLDQKFFTLFSKQWQPVFQKLLVLDPDRINDLLQRLSQSLFASKDAEIIQHLQILRRITWLVFISPKGQLKQFLPPILEKLTDFLKGTQQYRPEILFCLSCLVYMYPQSLQTYFPTIIHLLLEILQHTQEMQQLTKLDLQILSQACLLLSVLRITNLDTWIDWLFSNDTGTGLLDQIMRMYPQEIPQSLDEILDKISQQFVVVTGL